MSNMEQFIGVKLVNAKAMTLGEYNTFRGWNLPPDEDASTEGMLVEYVDGGEANTPEYDNYVSWCPKDVFDRNNRSVTGMSFGMAIEAMKKGFKVARAGWNGKGMWLVLIRAGNAMSHGFDMQDCIGIKNAQNIMQPGWHSSQLDMLSDDWQVIV